uniref:B3 domain-containing protein At5g24050-like n=1 Tax=Nicotiana sylvestris TaxID=4096 RepID=A0A1U7W5U1_NICSY|nr:PREDICTED: B3 domain-containing protein At5g24050-like [Nicotiana sylvestris]
MSNDFLNSEEDAYLNTRNENNVSEMKVKLIEPSLEICDINLRKWNMNKSNGKTSSSYVLTTYWNAVSKRNALKIGTLVQLWAFRKGSELCFALVKL